MKYPIGIQSFEVIRNGGFVYVDKTDIIYRMAQEGIYYFMHRPRRFGKSLAVSTMQAYFEGRKELFNGLKIAELEKDWTAYPVLHLDLNSRNYASVEALRSELEKHLVMWEAKYGDDYKGKAVEERFFHLVRMAAEKTGRQVVILIDEYDKPLLQSLGDEALQDKMRAELKAFYSVLKTQSSYIRFAFLTGVTKFSKVSVFSDLNNLKDISLSPSYERLCGISSDELEDVFKDSIADMAKANGITFDEAYATLKRKYDGYHFSSNMTDMFNPFSLLNAFSDGNFGNYWFESGTPTFLVELLRKNDVPIESLENCDMDAQSMGNVDVINTDPLPVLYQSGYLTIKGYDREFMLYKLGFPNEEVRDGFLKFLLPFYANVSPTQSATSIYNFIMDLRRDDIDAFMQRLASFFAGYNYDLIPRHDLERHYQNVIFTVCRLIGLRVEAEYRTSSGRIDMLLATNTSVFIFEFKLNVSSKAALRQAERKDYAAQFATDKRHIYIIGVNFSSEIRGIEDWKIEER